MQNNDMYNTTPPDAESAAVNAAAQPTAAFGQTPQPQVQTPAQGYTYPYYGTFPAQGVPGYGYHPYMQAPPRPKEKKQMSTGFIVFICALCAVLIFGFGVMVASISKNASKSNQKQPDTSVTENFDSLDEDALKPGVDSGGNDLVIGFDKKAQKAVSTSEIARQSQNSVLGISIYGTDGVLSGEASGIVVGVNSKKTKTYIVTCAHVITDSKDDVFKIVDQSGKEYLAAVIGYDESVDVGVLSVEKVGFESVKFGDSAAVKSGESVIAVGNPGGSEFFGSVTKGVVSATDRMLVTTDSSISCIQHDAAINPGSSGGALYNVYGQVVGINYAKIALQYYEGMNFAIPSNTVVERANKIIAKGLKTKGAKIGIEYYVAASYFDENYKQLVINSIDEKSDMASKAEKGDFIIAVEGEKITDKYTIVKAVTNKSVGEEIRLTIAHKNEKTGEYDTKEITVKLIEK